MKKAFWLIISGVAIGILLAPDKGSVTWQKLVDQIKDLRGEASDRVNDVEEKGKNLVNQGINRVEREADKL